MESLQLGRHKSASSEGASLALKHTPSHDRRLPSRQVDEAYDARAWLTTHNRQFTNILI